ncbi:TIGR04141 family sporadically distributed protein [Lentzea waywayandensis]|uniref:TIGR04141 family sporadically distributed protein n=1 Tax=Lentzea waywayandensis TaxID=84724 RepID=UPI0015A503DC|nr:TIGR04141 family sporadically distributed protein [Lentzea waywayandensis]
MDNEGSASATARATCPHQGKWYEIGKDAVERVKAQVAELLLNRSTLSFPLWVPSGKTTDEHDYAAEKVAARQCYLCLDSSFATTPMHLRFELADIAGRVWDAGILFSLSRVSLLRLSYDLHNLGIELQFADIPFVARKKGQPAAKAAWKRRPVGLWAQRAAVPSGQPHQGRNRMTAIHDEPRPDSARLSVRACSSFVGLTHQHTNRSVLVEGPEITIRPVGTRRLAAGGSR